MEQLVIDGDNLLPRGKRSSEIEGETEGQTRTRWYSAAIIHYTGDGLWSVGVVPHDSQSKWEWLESQPIGSVGKLLADTKFRICPTETLLERLRESS